LAATCSEFNQAVLSELLWDVKVDHVIGPKHPSIFDFNVAAPHRTVVKANRFERQAARIFEELQEASRWEYIVSDFWI
jgi:hypothetical protein